MLRVKLNGDTWLSQLRTSYGPVTIEFGEHGSEAASWDMAPSFRHPLLRANVKVEIYDGGIRCWVGRLNQPGSDGQVTAKGAWRQGESLQCIDQTNSLTTVPDGAVLGAWSRGEIDWVYATSISAVGWGGTGAENPDLVRLLDAVALEAGMRWRVNANWVLEMKVDPTIPTWHVPHAVFGHGLTPAEDEFFTHLIGEYMSGVGTYDKRTIGSATAEAYFGRRPVRVDLTPMGIISAARADQVLTGMLLLVGARMGWGEQLNLGHGQLTVPGGKPAPLAQVNDGQLVRLAGTVDPSKTSRLTTSTDIVIGRSVYTDGSRQIQITPQSYAARNLQDILTVAVTE